MVQTHEVRYVSDGAAVVGHVAFPDGEGPWPAVLVGHDGIGLDDDFQRRRADHLAARGHVALAMDYHGGRWPDGDVDAAKAQVRPLIANRERMQAVGRSALDVLLASPGVDPDRLAAVGYGAGGSIVLELARAGVAFRGVAVVHPAFPATDPSEWVAANGSFLLVTGSEDPLCTPAQVLEFGRALQEAGLDWRAHVLGGAKHAFWSEPACPDDDVAGESSSSATAPPRVDRHGAHTTRAWRAVLDLLDETVGDAGSRSA